MTQTTDIPASQTPALWPGALEEARSLIGVELRRHDQFWNTEANPDSVRQFCWAVGDENPLFCDPHHGARSPWGAALAPGCFLYTIDSTIVADAWCGSVRRWSRPLASARAPT